jgi:hypothetical protein
MWPGATAAMVVSVVDMVATMSRHSARGQLGHLCAGLEFT